jgi:hypothetical protein
VTTFYLGTHRPNWLALTDAPLFVSRRRLEGYRALPRARGAWALDSGGFSEISLHGAWLLTAAAYVALVRRFAQEVGGMAWAAIQDWMCEPAMLGRTGLDVAEHQRRTVASYLDLRDRAPDLPWVPVLQGWRGDEYLRHVDAYDRAGVDLRALPVVGLGTVCRRQGTAEAEAIVRRLAGLGLRLHGFGFKTLGLARVAAFLASADSMAWSFRARKEGRRLCRSGQHRNCANCLEWALAWRRRVLDAVAGPRWVQGSLLLEAAS